MANGPSGPVSLSRCEIFDKVVPLPTRNKNKRIYGSIDFFTSYGTNIKSPNRVIYRRTILLKKIKKQREYFEWQRWCSLATVNDAVDALVWGDYKNNLYRY